MRVLLAEDEPKLAMAVQALCESQEHLEVTAVVATAEAAIEGARADRPDVVLLDIRLDGTDGIEAALAIRAAFPEMGVVIYSGDDEDVLRARSLGFRHALVKGAMTQELIATITAAGRSHQS